MTARSDAPTTEPAIGRIVHYLDPVNVGSDPVPAIISRIRPNSGLDIHVFSPWRATSFLMRDVLPQKDGKGTGWFWPPRK